MASSNTGIPDDQLLISLAADLITQAWVAMGKIKNPITDKMEPNLPASALLIDMLDMLHRKTEGHRSEEETKLLEENVQQLKLNYIAEKQAAASKPSDEADSEDTTGESEDETSDDAVDNPTDDDDASASGS